MNFQQWPSFVTPAGRCEVVSGEWVAQSGRTFILVEHGGFTFYHHLSICGFICHTGLILASDDVILTDFDRTGELATQTNRINLWARDRAIIVHWLPKWHGLPTTVSRSPAKTESTGTCWNKSMGILSDGSVRLEMRGRKIWTCQVAAPSIIGIEADARIMPWWHTSSI